MCGEPCKKQKEADFSALDHDKSLHHFLNCLAIEFLMGWLIMEFSEKLSEVKVKKISLQAKLLTW